MRGRGVVLGQRAVVKVPVTVGEITERSDGFL